jgi:hypothetical protein
MYRQQVIALGRDSAARLRRWLALAVLGAAATVLAARPLHAQDAEAAPRIRSGADLEQLVGPIALYADDLIGIVLPASTYPLQIVQAARFIDARAKDSALEPNNDWDDSVVALLNYPEVVKRMNDDLDWTYDLGEAVLNQRADVLDAIQKFRSRAYTSGNLRSDDKQVVANADNEITIKPANPQVIYVPYYEPERVVVYQSAPVYYYYPYAYPVYYYPYPVGYSFHSGFFWGVTTAFVIGWHSHYVNVYHCGYYGHPYYGHVYHDPYYVRSDIHVNVALNHSGGAWNPGPRRDGRPYVRSDDHYVRTPGTVRTPGVVRTPATETALREQGRAGSTFTTPGAQNAERGSAPAARSGSYRNPGQTHFATPPATADRTTTLPRPSDNGSAATRGRTPTTPATPPRNGAAPDGGGSSSADSDPRRGVPERLTSPGNQSARLRYAPPAPRYSTPNGSQDPARNAAPPVARGNGGGSYRSGGPTQPPSEARSWSSPAPPQVARPAPSYDRGGGAPQDRGTRSESRSSFAAPAAPPPRDSGGGQSGSQGGGSHGGSSQGGGGSYRGHGGSQGNGGDASRHGSR